MLSRLEAEQASRQISNMAVASGSKDDKTQRQYLRELNDALRDGKEQARKPTLMDLQAMGITVVKEAT